MSIVAVTSKFHVVIPRSVREQVGVAVGDLLEVKAEKGKIVFQPKSVVDRGIAQSLEGFKRGQSFGPFDTHEQFIASLHKEAKKLRAKKSKRATR